MLLFAALTLILTVATVWGGRIWLRNSETLVFAVGDANSIEGRFAAKLATKDRRQTQNQCQRGKEQHLYAIAPGKLRPGRGFFRW